MLADALQLTIIGMSIVFIFLIILIIVIMTNYRMMGYLARIFPEENETPAKIIRPSKVDCEIAISIAAAKRCMKE